MTHEETIKALDKLIVYLNSAILEVKLSRYFKDNVIAKLREINVSYTTIQAIANIEIEEYNSNSLSHHVVEMQHLEKERIERNKQSIQSMIDILSAERARFVEEEARQRAIAEQENNIKLQEAAIAEQKKGNEIQNRALWLSVIATIASVIATVISIIALYK